jgi:uncharacterized membrane protein
VGDFARVGKKMAEVSRILTALGLVIAAVALTTYGIATAFADTPQTQENLSLAGMIVGVIAAAIGIVMSKQIPDPED